MNIVDFDPSKPVQTRCGKPATILCTDLKSPLYTIGARIVRDNGEEILSGFTAKGNFANDFSEDNNDLVNVGNRLKLTCWLNVYPTRVYAFQSKEQADAQAAFLAGRITCIDLNLDIPQP